MARGIGLTVVVDAADKQMDVFDSFNQQVLVVAIAESGDGDELASAAQADEHILAKV